MGRSLLAVLVLPLACSGPPAEPAPDAAGDLTFPFPTFDLAQDLTQPNACGDYAPGCHTFQLGPDYGTPFPQMPFDSRVNADDVGIDKSGALIASFPNSDIDWALVANSTDWGRGTLSRVSGRTNRELARYFTVTCSSLVTGSTAACDGMKGCCSNDDPARFAARLAMQLEPGHQAVQLADNYPSRTDVEACGDSIWVQNRAPAGQASVTRISTDPRKCIDHNGDKAIQTSSDVNGDGIIETDCNGDGLPDDIASVKGKPCSNGFAQEFFGLDDECILFTTNVGAPGTDGRALALGPGRQDWSPSDPWAGTAADASFYRTDGATGMITDRAMLPVECRPDGLIVDSSSVAWSVPQGAGPLCWFNTKAAAKQGEIRDPQSGPLNGRVVSLDRDQNLWLADRAGNGAYRYTPDRSAGTAKLGNGAWTRVTNAGLAAAGTGKGVAVALDSRSPNSYFAWLTLDSGWLVRIPASTLPLPKVDQTIDGSNWPAVPFQGFAPVAVSLTGAQNVLIVSGTPSATLLAQVDWQTGNVTAPDLVSQAMPPDVCPAGGRCLLKDGQSEPGSDSYSNLAPPRCPDCCGVLHPSGSYAFLIDGCVAPQKTTWLSLDWHVDVPLNTTFTAKARAGDSRTPDQTWGAWTPDQEKTPVDLTEGAKLVPEGAQHLQVEFDFATLQKNATPRLFGFQVAFRCTN